MKREREFKRITIIKPPEKENLDLNSALQIIGGSLGLFTLRDKDKSCFRIFIELLKNRGGITSDDLAEKLSLSRGTVVFHLNKLIMKGIVVARKNKYYLTEEKVENLIRRVEEEIETTLNKLLDIAREVDRGLNR